MEHNEAFEFSESILRYLKKELGKEEERTFLDSVSNDIQKKKLLDYYRDRMNVERDLKYYKSVDTNRAWEKVMAKKKAIEQTSDEVPYSPYNMLKRWLPYAAILVCIMGFGIWMIRSNHDDQIVSDKLFGFKNDVLARQSSAVLKLSNGDEVDLGESKNQFRDGGASLSSNNEELIYPPSGDEVSNRVNEIKVSNAGRFKVVLSDGSVVWVSSSSKLKYPVTFNGTERRVSLEGEAYFDIAKDAKKPFYVEVGGKTIRVIGTQFNVSAYTSQVRTTLVEGSVRIQDGKNVSMLKPGQQAVSKSNGIVIQPANVQKDIAWKNGYFTFERDQIEDIMEEVSRWYEVTVIYEGRYKGEVYSGSIPRSSSLGGVLQALTDVSGLHFEIDGRKVKVKKD